MRLPSFSRPSGNRPVGTHGFFRSLLAAAVLGMGALGTGCADRSMHPGNSFIDQTELTRGDSSKNGLLIPILNHLNQQDQGIGAEFTRAVKVRGEDLVPSSSDYIIGKNDLLTISITDLVGPGIESVRQSRVTESGKISMPLVPQITAQSLTEAQLEQAIVAAYRDANLIANAQVSVTVTEARARTFTIAGAIAGPGEYAIVRTDFRLLDALALSHDTTSTTGIDYIYIIRKNAQVHPAMSNKPAAPAAVPTTNQGADPLAPHSMAPLAPNHPVYLAQDAAAPASAPADTGGLPAPGFSAGNGAIAPAAAPASAAATTTPVGDTEGRMVVIDGKAVPADRTGAPMAMPMTPAADATAAPDSSGNFEFDAPAEPTDSVVIKVPIMALRAGELKYNVIIRPGDYIYVPQPMVGEYYMGGHVARPGVYSLSARKITLKEAFISAGMLDQVAIPGRTEIIRRIEGANGDREIFAIVDIEKVFAGSEPDVYLRPDDQILVGTNVVAPFLAAIRNGFRITYGFGFLYDRNFYTGR